MIRTLLLSLLVSASAFAAPSGTRRFAIVAGADDGGAGRARLRYAASDARQVASVLTDLGGVDRADLSLIEQPSRAELARALGSLKARIAGARAGAERVEVILYYSGHSDEDGLLLRGERFGYEELRAALDGAGADVRVAILDSCASGAFTRAKGGVSRPAFLLDASREVRGRAFLTSASADEAAQESDRVGGSFFTHFLVSGLRGAADTSRSGRVTLNDAYRFAFAETLARTQSTRAGPQHPAYDIALNGSGDLVLTDLRSAGATLVLPPELDGRVYVRDASDRLVVELRKTAGDPVRLGLTPGTYSVAVETSAAVRESRVRLSQGEEREPGGFTPVARERVTARGGPMDAKWLPVNVSFVPPLSVNALYQFQTVNAFAFDVLVGYSAGLEGFELSGLGSVNGQVRGVALGGVFNWSNGSMRGVQLGGVVNFAGGETRGAQVGGVVNVAPSVIGWQLAGAVNVADDVTGLQLAPVNVAREASGAQVGVFNVADDADVAVGVLSWVRKGTHNVAAAATEFGSMLEADTGGRIVYGILAAGAGFRFRSQPQRYLLGGGIGWRPIQAGSLSVDLQAVSLKLVDSNAWSSRGIHSARAVASLRVAGPVAVFAGPTFNVLVDQETRKSDPVGYGWSAGSDVRLWPGFVAGVRVF